MNNYLLTTTELDEILRKVDIVKVISNYITLTQKGRNYLGICPFHNDSNPSLTVSPEKKIFKCFVCGAGGNAFTFVSQYEKVPFIQSVKTACAITGIDIPKLNKYDYNEYKASDEEKRLYELMETAHAFYSFQLKVNAGEKALTYLKSRFMSDDLISHFNIGYSLDDGKLIVGYLTSKGFTIDEILKSGLATSSDGEASDMMRSRITFAIKNHAGKLVAFSGRRFDAIKEQKYINTSETPIFHKSNVLYHYSEASLSARKNGCLYIVEGFMDVIALYRAGIENVVATMGTALTLEHIAEIEKLKCEVRILFDSDRAGNIATLKAIDLLEEKKLKIKVVANFIDGKDSDELINKFGKEALIKAVNTLVEPFDYRLEFLQKNLNLANHDDRKKFVNDAILHLNKMTHSNYDEEYYLKKISTISGFSKELVVNSYHNSIKKTVIPNFEGELHKRKQVTNLNRYEKAQRQIINKMLSNPLVIAQYQADEVYMYDFIYRRICAYIVNDFNLHGKVYLPTMISQVPEELRIPLLEISEEIEEPVTIENLFDTLKTGMTSKLEIDDLKEKMLQVADPKEQAKIAAEMLKTKQNYESNTKKRIEKDRGGSKQ